MLIQYRLKLLKARPRYVSFPPGGKVSFSFCRCSEESVMLRIMDRDCSSSDIRKRSKGGGVKRESPVVE